MQTEMATPKMTAKRRKSDLAPIERHPEYFKDTFKHSFLLTHDLEKQREKKLNEIMYLFVLSQ